MIESTNRNAATQWCDQRRTRLNELIISRLFELSKEDLRKIRSSGHVFASHSDIARNEMTANSVRIVFGSWDEIQSTTCIDGLEWLMAFDFVVEYFDKAAIHVTDPSWHPWAARFDAEPPKRILALLTQFVARCDPIFAIWEERRHRSLV